MKKIVGHLIRFAVTGACLAYALWGVDVAALLEVFASFRPLPTAVLTAYVLFSMLVPGARLSFLTEKRLGVFKGLQAVTLGLGLNNILPARLGEVAKTLYIKQNGPMSMSRALEAVFWERFFDLNALLLLGLATALLMGRSEVIYPLLALVGGIWLFLGLVWLRPKTAHALLRFMPMEKVRLLFGEVFLLLESKFALPFMGTLCGYTLAAWVIYTGTFFLGLLWVAGLDLTWIQVLTVFAVATLGFAVPAAPGGMGVYEAAFVLALGWFGYGREEAFAVGFMIHMTQYIPLTLLGLGVMGTSGFSLKGTRRQAQSMADEG